MKTVAIVIPIYKTEINESELLSLEHLKKYLYKYDRLFIMPKRIKSVKRYKEYGTKFIKFPNKYFKSRETYNNLLLSKNFYLKFKSYKYILIYQLDSLVFSDQLSKWCKMKYDYIGAPWFISIIGLLSHKDGCPASGGNGGFSLRNVQKSLRVIDIANKYSKKIKPKNRSSKLAFISAVITNKSHKIWLKNRIEYYPFNEDGFWSLEAPKYLKNYKVADFKTSLKFSFEKFPKISFMINKRNLPFGCHAWAKYGKKFWISKAKLRLN